MEFTGNFEGEKIKNGINIENLETLHIRNFKITNYALKLDQIISGRQKRQIVAKAFSRDSILIEPFLDIFSEI